MAAPADGRKSEPRPGAYVSEEARELLPPAKITELLEEVAPGETLDKDVQEFLQEHIDEFVEGITDFACRLAKHRKSRTLEARDLQLHLEKTWNIRVPGYGDDPRPIRRPVPSPGHYARLQAIAKAQSNSKPTKPRS